MSRTQLHIALLGLFQVTRGESTVTEFKADTARALLAYLALHAGTPFRREALADLLWPEAARAEALHALRQALSRLRRAIGDCAAAGGHDFLHVTRQTLQFNADSDYWLDVSAFCKAIAATRIHPHRRLAVCQPCMARLEEAAALYRGDLLSGFYLDSLPFEEWLLTERERLHRQALEVFSQLADSHEACGAYAQAQAYARRQLALEPWREKAQRQLMRALALSGQRGAALAQYESACRVLAEELNVAPAGETQALYAQIRADRLQPAAPPPHNLPAPLTPFVGRQAELAALTGQINHPERRLITLVGPGGIGKTRLMLQVATAQVSAFRDGVYFVPLSGVDSPDALAVALAQALNFEFYGARDPWPQLRSYLRQRELLLLFDNFEHLLPAACQVSALLQGAPEVKALVTSRQRLNVHGECPFPVGGLGTPCGEADDAGAPSDAVTLFVVSARRACPDFCLSDANRAAVTRIVQRVEGMPLAIELAAAWRRVLSCQEIVQEIQDDLDFLQTALQDVPPRHRSLRAVFDASWALLSETERATFQKLSVLRGRFDRAAAQAVSGATPLTLAALVDQSLLRQEMAPPGQKEKGASPRARYEMHDLLQRYAAEKLSTSPEQARQTRERQCHYYTNLLRQNSEALKGPQQRRALETIQASFSDVRAAWHWAAAGRQTERLAAALEGMFLFYETRGAFQEGAAIFAWAAEALAADDDGAPDALASTVLAQLMACQGWFAFRVGQRDASARLLQQSLERLRALDAPLALAFTLTRLGEVAVKLGAYDEVQQRCQESLRLYRAAGDDYGSAMALNVLGQAAYLSGAFDEAERYSQQSLALARDAGFQQIAANSLRQLGNIGYLSSHYEAAMDYYAQALERYRAMGNRWGESTTLSNMSSVPCRQGDCAQARAYLEQSLVIKREIGERWGEAQVLSNLGVVCAEEGAYVEALDYYQQALAIREELGARRGIGQTINNMGNVYRCLGQYAEARDYLERALALRHEVDDRQGESLTLETLSLLLERMGDPEAALACAQKALDIVQALGERAIQAYALTNMAHAQAALGKLEPAARAYRQAVTLRRELGEGHLALESLAGLARLALAAGDPAEAQAHVEEILTALEAHTLDGTDEPLRVYLTCVQVLAAHDDPRAPAVLEAAHALLQTRAARIHDDSLRQTFLHDVPEHRELLERYRAVFNAEAPRRKEKKTRDAD